MYLTQGLHRMLQQDPEALATVYQGRHQSFRTLGQRVAQLAGALVALGLQPGDRVAMLALNSDRYLESLLGTWWAGGVVNPVNTRWSVAEMCHGLEDCETRLLLVDAHFLPQAEAILARTRLPLTLVFVGDEGAPAGWLHYEALLAQAAPLADVGRGGDDLAAIMYTGGTTGRPKGVMQSHANLWTSSLMRMAAYPIAPGTRVLHVAPMFHTACLARVVSQVIAGLPHVFLPQFDATAVLRTLQDEQINDVLLVPTMLQALLQHPQMAQYDLRHLRHLVYGASPIAAPVLKQALHLLPGVAFQHGYGMTESSPVISINGPESHTLAGIASGRVYSAGRAVPGVSVRIVNAAGQEVAPGTVGEVVVRGPNVMQGYWNRPQETAAVLREGWLYTGDGAWMDEAGYLYLVDRLKDMIVTGGENVYSAEVENALASHAAVLHCAVIGVPSATWGEAVHAAVVLRPGMEVTTEALLAHCRGQIAGYKCPKSIEFVEALPLSGAGKVLKSVLREPFWREHDRAVG